MSKPIEDYGFIGNMITGALVARDGSMDWLCLPRFDSDACFAALLGNADHGCWKIAPANHVHETSRRYLPHTLVLETVFNTDTGTVSLTDFMPLSEDGGRVEVIRLVKGLSGSVRMEGNIALRFGFGRSIPWVRRRDYGFHAVAGPDVVEFATPAPLRGEGMRTVSEFTVREGDRVPFTLSYHRQNLRPRFIEDREIKLAETVKWWEDWSAACRVSEFQDARWAEAVERSLITLKALTYRPSGGIVAALTTSLPEAIGGVRNWDYRHCWIRDATLTLYALTNAGYFTEAEAFREWLLRAAAGAPDQLQIMYGIDGKRRLTEDTLSWLPGYENSAPVRIGNAACEQVQLDVYGELMDALHMTRMSHLDPSPEVWRFQKAILLKLEELWREPDEGIWEVRGGRQYFVYSKMMAWVAFDRAVKAVERWGFDGDAVRWRKIRDEIHAEVLARGYDASRNTFVQRYDAKALDASLLLMAGTGFLPPEDPRVRGTVDAIVHELMNNGFLMRYRHEETDDGLSGAEGAFLVCNFWLADAYTLIGRRGEAVELFERLLLLRNDLGLLAEQYDPILRRLLGNFPQAFSHIGLVNTAFNLLTTAGPVEQRAERSTPPHKEESRETAV